MGLGPVGFQHFRYTKVNFQFEMLAVARTGAAFTP